MEIDSKCMARVTTEIDLLNGHPNMIGEFLRDRYFDQDISDDAKYYRYGCYSTFEIRDLSEQNIAVVQMSGTEAQDLMRMHKEDRYYLKAYGYRFYENVLVRVDMGWYWDGDGVLRFEIVHCDSVVRILENPDCKKDYRWKELSLEHARRNGNEGT